MLKRALTLTYRAARRIVITVVGFTVVLIGVVLIFTPGPAFVVIPIGLAILGVEFAWARRLLRRVKDSSLSAINKVKGTKIKEEPDHQTGTVSKG